MNVCEFCGSGSHDQTGICAGCGAKSPLPSAPHEEAPTVRKPPAPYRKPPAKFSAIGLDELQTKQSWIAIPLALIFGPIGLIYCSGIGAVVMFFISLALGFFLGRITSYLIVAPICAAWAWVATRETRSALD